MIGDLPSDPLDVEALKRKAIRKLKRTLRAHGVDLPKNAPDEEVIAAAVAKACTDPAAVLQLRGLQQRIAAARGGGITA